MIQLSKNRFLLLLTNGSNNIEQSFVLFWYAGHQATTSKGRNRLKPLVAHNAKKNISIGTNRKKGDHNISMGVQNNIQERTITNFTFLTYIWSYIISI